MHTELVWNSSEEPTVVAHHSYKLNIDILLFLN